MNERIYNEQVASFKEKVKTHEEAIIEGKKIARDLNEFIELHEELNDIIDEYKVLSQKSDNSKYKQELESYLKEELDYLELIETLMDDLDKYHDVIGLVDSNMIASEWDDVKVIVTIANLERTLKRVSILINTYPEEQKYKESYDRINNKYEKLTKRAIEAQHNMLERTEMNLNSVEAETKDDESLLINEVAYEEMDLSGKIKYLETIMDNILHTKGKKHTIVVDGERKNISKKYVNRYMKYNAMLSNLYMEYAEEVDFIANLGERIESQTNQALEAQYVEKYWSVRAEMQDIQDKVNALVEDAKFAADIAIVHVTFNGKSIRILKTDLKQFEALEQKSEQVHDQFEAIMSEYGILTEEYQEEKTDDEIKEEIIEKIRFLKQSGVESEALDETIKDLISKYCKVEKRKRFTSILGLTRLFKKQGFSKEEADRLARICYNPEGFQKSKGVSDQEKNTIFNNIFRSLSSSILNPEIIEEEYIHSNKKSFKEKMNIGVDHVKKYAAKALKAIKSMPKKNGNFVSKIKNVKKSKNKEKLKSDMKKRIPQVALVLGMAGIIVYGASKADFKTVNVGNNSNNKPNIESESSPIMADEKIEQIIADAENSINESLEQVDIESNVNETINKSDHDIEDIAENMGEQIYDAMEKDEKTEQIIADAENNINESLGKVDIENNVNESINQSGSDIENITEQIRDSIEKEDVAEQPIIPEESNIDILQGINIGGIFSTNDDAKIYTNMYDASTENNGLNPYFAASTNRVITGIAYSYNGSTILLDQNDPDFEAKKTALEANGAVLVAVQSQNEESQDKNNYEGYWNIDDINMKGR